MEDNIQEVQVESINQVVLAQSVSENIKYDVLKDVLVKPLEPVMIEKEVQVPKVKKTTNDEASSNIQEYDELETKIERIKSAFRRGVVLKLPIDIPTDTSFKFNVGDIVVYNERMSKDFDLLKDSQLVKAYDIVAIEK
jgi:hypothetical protein